MDKLHNHAPGSQRALAGLDRFLADDGVMARLATRQVGLLTNHACATVDGVPTARAVRARLAAQGADGLRLYSPEHGMALSAHAGEPVDDRIDPLTGLTVHSLYGGPDSDGGANFRGLDTLVIDLRDVGVRCYTYAATAAQAARSALEQGIDVVVCDRPNPLGPNADGPGPDPGRRSLLAFFDVPFIHGLTIGELVRRHATPRAGTGARLDIYHADAPSPPALGWIPPSPALAHPDAVAAYGGLVLLEATNVSEGRNSSLAFRGVSAHGLDAVRLAGDIAGWNTGFGAAPGEIVHMRGSQAGARLPGLVLWPRSNQRQRPLALGIHLLAWLMRHHADFAWASVGADQHALDNLFGRADLRQQLEQGIDPEEILAGWQQVAA
jgi:uncharacterized protein YbbC (DUF1343 family)